QPYFVTPADGSVFAMAGLYEFWRDPTLPGDHANAWWVTCSVITTEAETTPLAVAPAEGPGALADIHPRMPLMLTPD
ncbi:SOS response-associated peptidase, partial [Streptomyces sp. SID8455]|nr:SOS response-associated peptidase [Streptomyces sp. SID8455]